VVIVGGGFAGVGCAKRLAGEPTVRVTVLDKNGYHQFQPLLYQVATAELTRQDMCFSLDKVFHAAENVSVRTAEVISADPHTRTAVLASGERVTGDVLVLAAGSQPNFFHTPGAEEFAYPLYSVDDAQRIRQRVLELFERAAKSPAEADQGALTFVVVGAGATGVEIAGSLAELVHDVLPHRYAHLAMAGARVILIDLGATVLAPFSEEAHAYAAKHLRQRGVQLRLGVSAKEITPTQVRLSDGSSIDTGLVVWGGGILGAPLAGHAGVPAGRGGRVTVLPDLTVPGLPQVYALGDFANIPFGDEEALPQLGSVAQQSGVWAAENILGDIEGMGRQPFRYRDKGIMAMIGRKAAVAEVGVHRHEMHGRIAFAAWLGVHAQLLANLGAEVRAFLSWAEEFYVRPHHRSAQLLDPSKIDKPRIDWAGTGAGVKPGIGAEPHAKAKSDNPADTSAKSDTAAKSDTPADAATEPHA
jgi:NADH dehydrogenase